MHEAYKLPVRGQGEDSVSVGAWALKRKTPGRIVWRLRGIMHKVCTVIKV
jgi:hypothetical protein